jgi:hypothetical protein
MLQSGIKGEWSDKLESVRNGMLALWTAWAHRWLAWLARFGTDGSDMDLAQLERGLIGVLSRQAPTELACTRFS